MTNLLLFSLLLNEGSANALKLHLAKNTCVKYFMFFQYGR